MSDIYCIKFKEPDVKYFDTNSRHSLTNTNFSATVKIFDALQLPPSRKKKFFNSESLIFLSYSLLNFFTKKKIIL